MKLPLDEKIGEIRDFINYTSPRKEHALMQNSAMWYMLCSSMDIIGDMEHALESFLIENPDISEIGRKYLLVFGALQALYVQQDAINNLHQALDIPYTIDSSIENIREIRNDAAGHPTNRRNKKAFNFINCYSLSVHEFQLMTLDTTNSNGGRLNSKHVNINIADLIATQRSVFLNVLDNVIETLKEEEVEHRKKFAGKKLVDALSNTTYPFTKIFDAVSNTHSDHAQLVGGYVDRILECYMAFRDGLKERGEPDDNISDKYEYLEYTLKHIKDYFGNTVEKTHIHGKDLYVFACFAKQKIDELRDTARYIDEKYSSDL